MKWLLLALVLIWGIWLYKRSRLRDAARSQTVQPPPMSSAQPETMLACVQCGVHAGQSAMLRGERGWYCSESHLQQARDRMQHV